MPELELRTRDTYSWAARMSELLLGGGPGTITPAPAQLMPDGEPRPTYLTASPAQLDMPSVPMQSTYERMCSPQDATSHRRY